jgi:group I intron endonuclease
MFVYKITNKINGMLYIGITTRTVHQRWLQHKGCALRGKIRYPLYNAMKHYGVDAFEVETVHIGNTLEEIQRIEIELIKKYGAYIRNGNGYNLTHGGENGHAMPPEIIEKARISRTGQKRTNAQKASISHGRKGKGLLNDSARKHPKENIEMAIELLKQSVKQSKVVALTGLSQPYVSRLKSHQRGQTILGA